MQAGILPKRSLETHSLEGQPPVS